MTKLNSIIKRLDATHGTIAHKIGLGVETLRKQLKNPDMRVSRYKMFAYFLKKEGIRKDDGTEWKWWELEGQVELKESE